MFPCLRDISVVLLVKIQFFSDLTTNVGVNLSCLLVIKMNTMKQLLSFIHSDYSICLTISLLHLESFQWVHSRSIFPYHAHDNVECLFVDTCIVYWTFSIRHHCRFRVKAMIYRTDYCCYLYSVFDIHFRNNSIWSDIPDLKYWGNYSP